MSKSQLSQPKLRFRGFDGEWKKFYLIDKCSFQRGITYSSKDVKSDGEYKVVRANNVLNDRFIDKDFISVNLKNVKDVFLLKKHDVLICSNSGSKNVLGKSCYINFDNLNYLIGGFMIVARNYEPLVRWFFQSKNWRKYIEEDTTTTIYSINMENLLKMKIDLPSLPEQQKIAQFFSLLDHHIKLWERKLELCQLKKKYYLDKIFANKDIPKLRFNQFFDDLNLNKIENLVLSMKSGGTPLSTKKEYYNGNINFLTISDMDDKYIYKTDKFISKKGLDNSSSYILSKNNLLISIYASLGKISINKIDLALPQSIVGVVIDNSKLNLEFIYQYLIYKNKWFKLNAQIGSQPNINIETLKKMNIFFPNLNEQQKIASFFEQKDKYINLCRLNIEKIKNRKKYYLNNLFI